MKRWRSSTALPSCAASTPARRTSSTRSRAPSVRSRSEPAGDRPAAAPGPAGSPRWFLAPPDAWDEDRVTLPASESHHALTVLRLRPGDAMTVTDGAGNVARGELTTTKGDRAVVSITSSERLTQPRPQLIVYQGAAKGHKLDLVVERLAELGVAELWAFTSERSVVRWDHDKAERATQRWQSIAESSSKQSRSAFTLRAGGVLAWPDLLARIRQEPSALVFWEEAATAARAVLPDDPERVALVVGPEGGLTPAEALALEDVGAPPVSLGPRILRTENAAAVAVAAVLWHYGLIG